MKWFRRAKACRGCGKAFRRAGKICDECQARRRRAAQVGSRVVGVSVAYAPGYDSGQDEEIQAVLERMRAQERGEVVDLDEEEADLDEDEAEALADEDAWAYEADDGSNGWPKWI